MTEDYSDIINLPHHVSHNHPQMPMMARAAQFAPFAALTGYDAVIHETARQTDKQVELEEYDNERLNRIFSELMDSLEEHPVVTVSYNGNGGRNSNTYRQYYGSAILTTIVTKSISNKGSSTLKVLLPLLCV